MAEEAAGSGRVALITGGAQGLGAAMAAGLSDAGLRVAVLDWDQEALDGLDLDVLRIRADVSDPAQCASAVERVVAEHGRLDVLVNNAALGMGVIAEDHHNRTVRIDEIAPEHWRRMFEVNCMGAFLMARAALPQMTARGWGRMVNVTTSFFTMLNLGFAPYGPAKAALESASAIWAKEFDGTGVTVNVLVPGGPADTRMVPAMAPFVRDDLIRPEAMVPPVRWLASPASDGVTGRRFVAALWDPGLPPAEAAEAAGAPIGWPQLTANVVWPGR